MNKEGNIEGLVFMRIQSPFIDHCGSCGAHTGCEDVPPCIICIQYQETRQRTLSQSLQTQSRDVSEIAQKWTDTQIKKTTKSNFSPI